MFTYKPKGVCPMQIDIELDGDIVKDVKFYGGCNGNLQGVSSLVRGRKVDEVIESLEGIKCGMKQTSCPDQLAKALRAARQCEENQ